MTPERMKALREGGMTYAEIASHAGCNPGKVWKVVNSVKHQESRRSYGREYSRRGNRSVWDWYNEQRGNPKATR